MTLQTDLTLVIIEHLGQPRHRDFGLLHRRPRSRELVGPRGTGCCSGCVRLDGFRMPDVSLTMRCRLLATPAMPVRSLMRRICTAAGFVTPRTLSTGRQPVAFLFRLLAIETGLVDAFASPLVNLRPRHLNERGTCTFDQMRVSCWLHCLDASGRYPARRSTNASSCWAANVLAQPYQTARIRTGYGRRIGSSPRQIWKPSMTPQL